MIRIVEGVPGSGKSYYGVNYVCDKFAKYDKVYDDFHVNPDVLIITNFEGFRIKHKQLDELLKKYGGVECFFNVPNFEKMIEYYRVKNVVLLIDEAQRYFDSKFYDKDVFYFFQYHRHLGIDIFLVTQKVSTVARHLLPLAEFIITAAPRSLAIGNTFRYRFRDQDGNSLYTQVLIKKRVVFLAYKSFNAEETAKPRNVVTRLAIMAVVMAVVVILGGKAVLAMMKAKYSKPIRPPQSSVPAPVPPPLPGPSPLPIAAPAPSQAPAVVPAQPVPARPMESRYFPQEPLPAPPPKVETPIEKPKKLPHDIVSYGMLTRDGVSRWWVRYADIPRMVELAPGCRVDEDNNKVVCEDKGGRGGDPDRRKS